MAAGARRRMWALPRLLSDRDAPVRVGIVGAGQFGTKCVNQLRLIDGMAVVGIADRDPAQAAACRSEAGLPDRGVRTVSGEATIDDVIEGGKIADVRDGIDLARADVDVILESTGAEVAGARHAYAAITTGTHVAMATCETDAIVGPLLGELARSSGVRYSPAYGDQPALTAELVAWADTCGFDVVAAGRGVGSYDANTAIELCVASNVTGLPPDTTGLHLPTVELAEAPNRLRPCADGGVLEEPGVLDGIRPPASTRRVLGASIADGVFVVVTVPNESSMAFMRSKNRAGAFAADDGDSLLVFRPHHMPGLETPVTLASLTVGGGHTGLVSEHVSDVVAIATEAIDPDEPPFGVGRNDGDARLRPDLRPAVVTDAADHVPYGLLDGAEIVATVEAGELITATHVDCEESFLHYLRGVQDALV